MGDRAATRLACPELVGRDEELATIAHVIEVARAGEPSIVLLSGAAGLGKSALLARAAAGARRAGITVLRGRGERLEMPRAFAPFVEALSAVTSGDAIDAAFRGAARLATAEDRYRAHRSFWRTLSELTSDRAVMLAIDDLHWADDSSLELLAYLGRRLRGGLVLVGAYRSEERLARPALRHAIDDLPRERVTEIDLDPLSRDEIARALRLTLVPSFRASRETRELLETQCGGNPLFLEEMLRALARRGDLALRNGVWELARPRSVPLPRSVEDTVHERLMSLDDTERGVLVLASVVGERFGFNVLRRASGLEERDLIAALRGGVDTQLIEEDRGADTFAFRHALVRMAVLQRGLERERRSLHRRVADALESEGDVDLAAVAHHREQAGDVDAALALHRRAGDDDARHGAIASAVGHYERARALATDDRTIADLDMSIMRLAGGSGSRARVLALVEDAIPRLERLGDARALAAALLELDTLMGQHLLTPAAARERCEERVATLLAPLGDTPELAWHLAHRMRAARARDDNSGALELGLRAIEIARRCGAEWEEGVATWAVAETYVAMGDVETALDWLRRTVAVTSRSPEAGRHFMELATSLQLLRLSRQLKGESDETRALATRIAQLRDDYPDERRIERLHEALYAPDWDEFVRLHDEWQAEEGDQTVAFAHMGLHRAFVDVARGDGAALDRVDELGHRLLARGDLVVRDTPAGPVAAVATGRIAAPATIEYVAQAALAAGDFDRVLAALDWAAPFVARPRAEGAYLTLFAVYAILAASTKGDEAAVQRWLDLTTWPEFGPPLAWDGVLQLTRRYVAAERDWRRGARDQAIACFATIVSGAPQDPLRRHLLEMRYCEMLMTRGTDNDRALAASTFDSVLEFYRTAKATSYLERLEARATMLGIPLTRPAEATPASRALTRREHEVARLVGRGLTNKEIAERLTLSVRTAESHVEKIRAKLGFRTRAQIAAWVSQRHEEA